MGCTKPEAPSTPPSTRPTSELRAAERIVLLSLGSYGLSASPDKQRLDEAAAMLAPDAPFPEALILAASWIVADEMRFG